MLFSNFGSGGGTAAEILSSMKPIEADDAASLLYLAEKIIIVPGYGMAVAQAQHKIWELSQQLIKRDKSVKFAIHPVAGRMPGHMNVLLAEAGVPYDLIADMDDINPEFPNCDVAIVIGANDVVNPVAKTDKSSPIYGMPILDVANAKQIIVIKRGKGTEALRASRTRCSIRKLACGAAACVRRTSSLPMPWRWCETRTARSAR